MWPWHYKSNGFISMSVFCVEFYRTKWFLFAGTILQRYCVTLLLGLVYRCGQSKYWYDWSDLKPIWNKLICQVRCEAPGLARNWAGTLSTVIHSLLLRVYMSNTVLTFFSYHTKQFDKVPDGLWVETPLSDTGRQEDDPIELHAHSQTSSQTRPRQNAAWKINSSLTTGDEGGRPGVSGYSTVRR